MNWFIYTIVFVLGLIIGSFINCIIYRLHLKQSFLHGRSFCPGCKKQINWYDNIPLLSYILLKAKCRFCRQQISIHYPLVEFISAALFLIVFIVQAAALNFNLLAFSSFDILILLRNWLFTSILILIFIYDLKYYLILDKVILPAILASIFFNLILLIFSPQYSLAALFIGFGWYLLAALVCASFFLIQFLVSRGKWIGGGDIRLGALMGFMLGWPNVLVALFLSYILGSIVGLILILSRQKTFKSQIPLGTFLTIGTFITLLFGQQILAWYLKLTF